jgi:hypothetical protein
METIMLANLFVFLIICFINVFIGLDLKKWTSWLYGLYGFLTGFWCSFIRLNADMSSRLTLGVLFAFAVMSAGAMARVHKQRYK